MNTLLIDGDSLLYVSRGFEDGDDPGPLKVVLWTLNNMISDMIINTGVKRYKLFIHGKGNFRKKICPDYKANRINEKPIYFWECREHLVNYWKAKCVNEIEVDDMVSILQDHNSIIAGIDKDLLQIPGMHYNYRNREFIEISEEMGVLNFYSQVLTGDISDNIRGVYGIGPKKALKILEGSETEKEMYERVREIYFDKGIGKERLEINCKLLYLLKHENDYWREPE